MTNLNALVDRVEEARGGDRDLAREVLVAAGWVVVSGILYGSDGLQARYVPDPLTSLDAAMSLVPNGHTQPGEIVREGVTRLGKAFNLHMSHWPVSTPYSEYLARYITAACLRARATGGSHG